MAASNGTRQLEEEMTSSNFNILAQGLGPGNLLVVINVYVNVCQSQMQIPNSVPDFMPLNCQSHQRTYVKVTVLIGK